MFVNSICKEKTDCASFVIFISVLLSVIFLKYIFRCIVLIFSQPTSSSLPLITPRSSVRRNTPVSDESPLYCRALKSIPLVTYKPALCSLSSSLNNNNNINNDDDNEGNFEEENCVICLGEFEKGERVRIMPRCKHVYHMECIDQWLLKALHCPTCRKRVMVDR